MVNSSNPVPILILMGTAGCGKTSVAEQIQQLLHCEYIEGDALHPEANVLKMSKGNIKPLFYFSIPIYNNYYYSLVI